MNVEELRELYEGKRYDEVFAMYNAAKDGEPEWHLYGSLAAWKCGEIVAALRAIERAVYHKTAPTGEVLLKCLFQYGDMLRRMGRLNEAVEEFDTCYRLLEEVPQMYSLLCGPTLYNLGLCFSGMANHRQAMAYYLRALPPFRDEHMAVHECMCLQNLAWTAIDMGDYDKVDGYMDAAADLGHNPYGNLALAAYLEYQKGNHARAALICEDTMKAFADGANVPADVQAIVSAICADVGFAQGDTARAQALAKHAIMVTLNQTDDERCYRIAKGAYSRINTAMRQATGG